MSRPPIPRPIARVVPAPVVREKLDTLELIEDDIVESQAVPKSPVGDRPGQSAPPPLVKKVSVVPPPVSMIREIKPIAAAPIPQPIAIPAAPKMPTRISVIDPIDVLFEGLTHLSAMETLVDAASLCARALANALGARAVLVHAHDQSTEEIRVLAGHGQGTTYLKGVCESTADDFVADGVLTNQKPLTMRIDGEIPRFAPRRVFQLKAERVLVAVPTMVWKRCAAMIEVYDPDPTYDGRAADAAAYVATRLGEFLVARAAA